jgi:hypothetical protein
MGVRTARLKSEFNNRYIIEIGKDSHRFEKREQD